MAINIRVYSHSGLTSPPVAGSNRPSADSLFLLKQPYLAGEVLSASTGASVASAAGSAPSATKLLHIQVAPGGRAHYKIETSSAASAPSATTSDPIVEGNTQIEFGPGWRVAFREAATDA